LVLAIVTASLGFAGSVEASATHGLRLAPVSGQGDGTVNFTVTPGTIGFSVNVTANIHGATPNTTFYISRAPEVGRPLSNDGICQRANGVWPWEQPNSIGYAPAPAFVLFPRPLAGDPKTLTTDTNGSGSAHFAFDLPTLADGTIFDVEIRLADSLSVPTTDLRTDCFTATVK
jgi:hypothetical protein